MPGNITAIQILSHLSLTTATWGRYCCYSFTNELDFVTKNISRLKELMPAFFLIFNVTLLTSNFRFCKNLEFHENEWLTPKSPTFRCFDAWLSTFTYYINKNLTFGFWLTLRSTDWSWFLMLWKYLLSLLAFFFSIPSPPPFFYYIKYMTSYVTEWPIY